MFQEIHKMFQETGSFYYCSDGDITNSIQRCYVTTASPSADDGSSVTEASWKRARDEFFWNKYMLQDLIESKVSARRSECLIPYAFTYQQSTCTCIV